MDESDVFIDNERENEHLQSVRELLNWFEERFESKEYERNGIPDIQTIKRDHSINRYRAGHRVSSLDSIQEILENEIMNEKQNELAQNEERDAVQNDIESEIHVKSGVEVDEVKENECTMDLETEITENELDKQGESEFNVDKLLSTDKVSLKEAQLEETQEVSDSVDKDSRAEITVDMHGEVEKEMFVEKCEDGNDFDGRDAGVEAKYTPSEKEAEADDDEAVVNGDADVSVGKVGSLEEEKKEEEPQRQKSEELSEFFAFWNQLTDFMESSLDGVISNSELIQVYARILLQILNSRNVLQSTSNTHRISKLIKASRFNSSLVYILFTTFLQNALESIAEFSVESMLHQENSKINSNQEFYFDSCAKIRKLMIILGVILSDNVNVLHEILIPGQFVNDFHRTLRSSSDKNMSVLFDLVMKSLMLRPCDWKGKAEEEIDEKSMDRWNASGIQQINHQEFKTPTIGSRSSTENIQFSPNISRDNTQTSSTTNIRQNSSTTGANSVEESSEFTQALMNKSSFGVCESALKVFIILLRSEKHECVQRKNVIVWKVLKEFEVVLNSVKVHRFLRTVAFAFGDLLMTVFAVERFTLPNCPNWWLDSNALPSQRILGMNSQFQKTNSSFYNVLSEHIDELNDIEQQESTEKNGNQKNEVIVDEKVLFEYECAVLSNGNNVGMDEEMMKRRKQLSLSSIWSVMSLLMREYSQSISKRSAHISFGSRAIDTQVVSVLMRCVRSCIYGSNESVLSLNEYQIPSKIVMILSEFLQKRTKDGQLIVRTLQSDHLHQQNYLNSNSIAAFKQHLSSSDVRNAEYQRVVYTMSFELIDSCVDALDSILLNNQTLAIRNSIAESFKSTSVILQSFQILQRYGTTKRSLFVHSHALSMILCVRLDKNIMKLLTYRVSELSVLLNELQMNSRIIPFCELSLELIRDLTFVSMGRESVLKLNLLQFLFDALIQHEDQLSISVRALRVIGNSVYQIEQNQVWIGKHGGLSLISHCMESYQRSRNVQYYGIRALRNCTHGCEYNLKLTHESRIIDGVLNAMEMYSTDYEIQEQSINLLLNLSILTHNCVKMIQLNGLITVNNAANVLKETDEERAYILYELLVQVKSQIESECYENNSRNINNDKKKNRYVDSSVASSIDDQFGLLHGPHSQNRSNFVERIRHVFSRKQSQDSSRSYTQKDSRNGYQSSGGRSKDSGKNKFIAMLSTSSSK